MVSFFGLKVGGKKKKSDGQSGQEKQPHQWKRIDQNKLGEGQLFGQNLNQKGVVNGSIRSVSRAGTPQSTARGRSSHITYDTHNLAAASMHNLTTLGPGRPGSQASTYLKPHASDANLRTRFGANNGSSTSLAAPAPGFAARFGAKNRSSSSLAAPGPGFAARFGANNSSSLSLAAPGPGLGSRPGTPGKSKAWVNPLDVHFVRSVPSGPPTPKSPLVDTMTLPPTPTTAKADTESVFGEEVDDMVDAVMATVKKREEERKKAAEKEKELEKQRETARLEMERLERQKSTESNLSGRRPSAPQLQPEPQEEPADIPNMHAHAFKGDHDARPGSRNGPARAPLMHQGPPPTGPPTHRLPQPPGQGPPRNGPLGPFAETEGPSGRWTKANASNPPSPRLNGFIHDSLPRSVGPPQLSPTRQNFPGKVSRPYQPPPVQGASSAGPLPHAPRTLSPPLSAPSIDTAPSQSPALKRPQQGPVVLSPEPDAHKSKGRSTSPPAERQGLESSIPTLASPSAPIPPPGSIQKPSVNDEVVEQFARPIIQHVTARRDTFQLNSPRRHSLSMKIEELEKSLVNAQQTHQAQRLQAPEVNRASASSSVYSNGMKDGSDDSDDDGPILPIQPAPLRIPSPMPPPVATAAAAASTRAQSPIRAPPRRGPLPRRPGLDEYGVASDHVALRNRAGTPTSASRSGSTDNYSSHSSPPSRTNTPQLRHPVLRRNLAQPSPAPTVEVFDRPRPSPVVDTGFNFDFGQLPGLGGPPTPDSSNWSLASPTEMGPPGPALTSEPVQAHPKSRPPSTKFTRANVPPPLNLKFNFSPDAPSRDPTLGLWTPPIRSVPTAAAAAADGRPSTSSGPGGSGNGNGNGNGGSKLGASPSLIAQFPEHVTRDDDRASFMAIGVARGPSIREVRRPKTSGARKNTPVDSFGTGFI